MAQYEGNVTVHTSSSAAQLTKKGDSSSKLKSCAHAIGSHVCGCLPRIASQLSTLINATRYELTVAWSEYMEVVAQCRWTWETRHQHLPQRDGACQVHHQCLPPQCYHRFLHEPVFATPRKILGRIQEDTYKRDRTGMRLEWQVRGLSQPRSLSLNRHALFRQHICRPPPRNSVSSC